MFEAAFYFIILIGIPVSSHPFQNFAAWSQPFATYDSVIGYRLVPNVKNDGIRIIKNDLQFYYQDIKANAAGFRSNYEYSKKKIADHRVVVYGDSFSAGLYQSRSWTESLQSELRALNSNTDIYNFSFDGGGVFNWHRHYFKELKGKYQFDTVIFAICCGDLTRGLATYHADRNQQQILYRKFNSSADSLEDFERNFKPRMHPVMEIMSAEKIQRIAEFIKVERPTLMQAYSVIDFEAYGARAFMEVISPILAALESWGYSWGKPIKDRVFEILKIDKPSRKTGESVPAKTTFMRSSFNSNKINEIIEDLKLTGKRIVLLTIPHDQRYIKLRRKNEARHSLDKNEDEKENQKIAASHCVTHISGYPVFDKVGAHEITKFWPSRDGHWLQLGSDYFAEKMAPKIKSIIDVPILNRCKRD